VSAEVEAAARTLGGRSGHLQDGAHRGRWRGHRATAQAWRSRLIIESDIDEFIAEVQARWIELGITDANFEGCDNAGLQRTESKRRSLAVLRLRALEPLPANC